MPSLGYKRKRNNIFGREFTKKVNESCNLDLDEKTIRDIVTSSNDLIFNIIADDPAGFKLPEGLGYIVVTKYKSNKKAIDWVNTKKYGKIIYLTNLHSFGYKSHIKWYKFVKSRFKYDVVYKLEPARFLMRKVAKNTKEGFKYLSWQNSDFLNVSKLDRLYNKKYNSNGSNNIVE